MVIEREGGGRNMGQYDILEFLENKWKKGIKKYYSVNDLRKYNGSSSVSTSCTKLRSSGFVDFIEMHPRKGNLYRYFAYRWKP